MKINRLSDILWKFSPNMYFVAILLSLFSGAFFAALIPFITYSIQGEAFVGDRFYSREFSFFDSPTSKLASVFLAVCFSIIVFRTASLVLSTYIAGSSARNIRMNLYESLQRMKIEKIERSGRDKIVNIVTVDILEIAKAAASLPLIGVAFVTIIGTLGYLFYLNSDIFYVVLVCLVVGIIVYQLMLGLSSKYLLEGRNQYDCIQEGIKGLVYGAKELRLNKKKASEYCREKIIYPENKRLASNVKGVFFMFLADSYGQLIVYLVVALSIFHLSYLFKMSQVELFGAVVALFYLTGPVGAIISTFTTIKLGNISLEKLNEFYSELECEGESERHGEVGVWNTYKVLGLGYTHKLDDINEGFSVKNASLEFEKGNVYFIVGGNGSGKTTLCKCLSLHYFPDNGKIYMGGELVTRGKIDLFRKNVSAIYSDFYLFDRLYTRVDVKTKEMIDEYLSYLELDGKVSFESGRFTNINLSDGQRKRLALLVLLMEDRDILIFDEWAADQDPKFKEFFYTKVIGDLKRKNKIVIVISHDDRYFHTADKIVTMENGVVGTDKENICELDSRVMKERLLDEY